MLHRRFLNRCTQANRISVQDAQQNDDERFNQPKLENLVDDGRRMNRPNYEEPWPSIARHPDGHDRLTSQKECDDTSSYWNESKSTKSKVDVKSFSVIFSEQFIVSRLINDPTQVDEKCFDCPRFPCEHKHVNNHDAQSRKSLKRRNYIFLVHHCCHQSKVYASKTHEQKQSTSQFDLTQMVRLQTQNFENKPESFEELLSLQHVDVRMAGQEIIQVLTSSWNWQGNSWIMNDENFNFRIQSLIVMLFIQRVLSSHAIWVLSFSITTVLFGNCFLKKIFIDFMNNIYSRH